MVKGVQDALADSKPMMTEEEMSGLLVQLKQKIMAKQQEEREGYVKYKEQQTK